jgi:hypothetical protein
MVTQETKEQAAKVEKRQSVGDLLREQAFHTELKMADKDAPLAGPIVLYDAQIREWDGEYGHTEYVLFVWAAHNPDGTLGEKQLGKIGGVAITAKFKKLLKMRCLPSLAGLNTVIMLNVSDITGRTYFDFAPF